MSITSMNGTAGSAGTADLPAVYRGQSQAPAEIAAGIVLITASTIAVVLRVVARRMTRANLERDDYMMFVALFFTWCNSGASFAAVRLGLGYHIDTLTQQDVLTYLKVFFAMGILLPVAVVATKVSILLLYLRLFSHVRCFRLGAYGLLIFTCIWGVVIILSTCLICHPITVYLNPNVPGHCGNRLLMFEICTAIDVIVDFLILTIPLPVVWRLKLSIVHRIQLSLVFILGSLTCIFTVVRFASLFHRSLADPTWTFAMTNIWSMAEPCIGIVCGCLPIMRPVFDKAFNACGIRTRRNTTHTSSERFTSSTSNPQRMKRWTGGLRSSTGVLPSSASDDGEILTSQTFEVRLEEVEKHQVKQMYAAMAADLGRNGGDDHDQDRDHDHDDNGHHPRSSPV